MMEAVNATETITINGHPYAAGALPPAQSPGIMEDLRRFLLEWTAPSPTVTLHTSGSTGTPKEIRATKEAMRASAALSCRILGLHPGDTALLCLPLRYIAGKMMVVRAIVGGLDLRPVEPNRTPLSGQALQFAAMTPMQAASILSLPQGEEMMNRVDALLLGGGFVDASLEQALQRCRTRAYASYGMTETLSHIALRRLNGTQKSSRYTPLPGVSVSLNDSGALVISAPHLSLSRLQTHDLAELSPDGSFRLLGRTDGVINSGGIKIQAEEVEEKLRALCGLELVIVAKKHPLLGQCVALLWEGSDEDEHKLRAACRQLPTYHRPKYTQRLPKLPRTTSGKIARDACRKLAELGD